MDCKGIGLAGVISLQWGNRVFGIILKKYFTTKDTEITNIFHTIARDLGFTHDIYGALHKS